MYLHVYQSTSLENCPCRNRKVLFSGNAYTHRSSEVNDGIKWKTGHDLAICACSLEGQLYTWLHEVWSVGQVKSFSSSTLLCSDLIWSTESCSEVPSTRQAWICNSGFREELQSGQRDETLLLWKQDEELGLFSTKKQRLWENLIAVFQYLKRAY